MRRRIERAKRRYDNTMVCNMSTIVSMRKEIVGTRRRGKLNMVNPTSPGDTHYQKERKSGTFRSNFTLHMYPTYLSAKKAENNSMKFRTALKIT
jgi:hypothetical protein